MMVRPIVPAQKSLGARILMESTKECFTAGNCVVYLGDALDILRRNIPDGSVDLVFADPPYNIGKRLNDFVDKWPTDEAYISWCAEWMDICISKLKSNGSMYVMSSTQFMPYTDIFLRERMHVVSRIVWRYDSSGVQARRSYGSLYEPIIFCVKDKSNYTFNSDEILIDAKTGAERHLIDYRKQNPTQYNSKKVPGNVWYFPRVRYRMKEYEEHPTQKPESLLERVVRASSNINDVVLDPFAGTFTTCAVANRLGRRSIGIELQEQYVKIGLKRLNIMEEYNGELLKHDVKNLHHKELQMDLSNT